METPQVGGSNRGFKVEKILKKIELLKSENFMIA